MNTQSIVVGGGAIGLCTAWELSKRGHDVRLLDRDQIGKATSWVAAGILPPANLSTATDPIDRLRGYSHQLFPSWARELSELTGVDPELRQCGGWYLADSIGEHAAMIGMADFWGEQAIVCERTDLKDLAAREPSLATWIQRTSNLAAWWVPDEYQIRSPQYLKSLIAACEKNNVKLHGGAEVIDIQSSSNGASVITAEQTWQADHVIVCAGSWTGRIAKRFRLEQSLVPVRGQILILKSAKPPLRSIANIGQRYVVFRDDGHTVIGACEEEVGFQLGNTRGAIDQLREFAFAVCPSLQASIEVGQYSGLRPMTFDGFPMIGQVPDTKNLYIATGHFRSGVHLSPATATAIADLVCGEKPNVDLTSFQIAKQQSNPFHQTNEHHER